MSFGYTGQILMVNLTSGAIHIDRLEESIYRLYPGGKALAAYLLLHEMPAHVNPLGPENTLVLTAGLLTGSPRATATRFSASARSPLTGGYGESEAGGFWGPELRQAGYDAVVIKGRNGMGAVMGSKNLKAVAVCGHQKYIDLAWDSKGLAALGQRLALEIEIAGRKPLTEVLVGLHQPQAEVELVMINGEMVDLSGAYVSNQDQIELYPPLRGGCMKYGGKNEAYTSA